jgi:hypothetical protein
MSIGKLYRAFGTAVLIGQAGERVMPVPARLEARKEIAPAGTRKRGSGRDAARREAPNPCSRHAPHVVDLRLWALAGRPGVLSMSLRKECRYG